MYKVHEIRGYIQTLYLVEQNDSLLLLDGGSRPDVEVVQAFIENDLKRNFLDLKLVIATHAHPDHVGGLSFYKSKGIAIAGPVELNSWYSGVSGFFTYYTDILLTWLVAINKKRGVKNIFFPRAVELDIKLTEGMEVPGFKDWLVLEGPGHTNVDLTIYNHISQIAYVADNFVSSKNGVFRPYPIFSPEKYKETLQRYIDLDIKDFLIAHYGKVEVPKERIKQLISSTPKRPRRHRNTLFAIFLKLFRSFVSKRT